ncbi:unnamed protein product [Cylindrotheca closterium]|uniref:Uncharacterized protein n=1 Tax=Cylindrotheca closterium TaxID=2856 RepID=A0AAD2FKJ3_9STRA|nr:unnamed protein product [Cylindrotheca closterium]
MARIDALPVDGNVSNQIPQVVHVVRPNNERTQGTQAKEGEEDAAAEEEQVPQQQVLEPGPDTSGATGAVGLDAGEVVVDDKVYIPQSLTNMNGLDSDRIRQFVLNGASAAPPGHSTNPIVMPPGGAPLSDYNTPNLQSIAFPTLFPHGVGDVISGDRLVKVKLNQANKHLLWYCLNKADRGLAP